MRNSGATLVATAFLSTAAGAQDAQPYAGAPGHFVLGLYGGGSATPAFGYQAPHGQDGTTFDGQLRLGWALGPLAQVLAEGRFGLSDWSCCSGSDSMRALAVRFQSNFLRTPYLDLFGGAAVGIRKDDLPGQGFLGPCPAQEGGGSSQCNWQGELKLAAGVELHITPGFHFAIEPEYGLAGRGRMGLHLGLVYR